MSAERKAELALAVAIIALALAISTFAGLIMYSFDPQPAWHYRQ